MKLTKKRKRCLIESTTSSSISNNNPNFLLKLYKILETPEYNDIIHWDDTGKYFLVKNLHDFTENILPKYYKHNNYSSFVRQLNMYDFHKKRSNQNEHIFQHKLFCKGQKELISTIKRKNKKDITPSQALPQVQSNEQALIEYFNNDNVTKKVTKHSLEQALNYLIKSVHENTEKQKDLEDKVEKLGKQNEDFLLQNQQMLKEILAKTEYNKELETVVCFILEMITKQKLSSTSTGISLATPSLNSENNLYHNNNHIHHHHHHHEQVRRSAISNECTSIIPLTDLLPKKQTTKNEYKTILDKYYLDRNNTNTPQNISLPLLTSGSANNNNNNNNMNSGNTMNNNMNSNTNANSTNTNNNNNNNPLNLSFEQSIQLSPIRKYTNSRRSSFDVGNFNMMKSPRDINSNIFDIEFDNNINNSNNNSNNNSCIICSSNEDNLLPNLNPTTPTPTNNNNISMHSQTDKKYLNKLFFIDEINNNH